MSRLSPEPAEIALHDRWAENSDPAAVDVCAVMEGANAVENRFLVDRARRTFGSLSGCRILDVGTGLGEAAVYFAVQGAQVTATDVSPGMQNFCKRLADHYGVAGRVTTLLCAAESLPDDLGTFDVIYAANLLHHLSNPGAFMEQAARRLRSPGLFLSYDPIVSNPAVWVYRRMARGVRSETERPLRIRFVKEVARCFESIAHREFWFFAQLLFLKYFVVDRIGPSHARYWKLIHRSGPGRGVALMRILHAVDRLPLAIPLLRNWGWNMAIVGRR